MSAVTWKRKTKGSVSPGAPTVSQASCLLYRRGGGYRPCPRSPSKRPGGGGAGGEGSELKGLCSISERRARVKLSSPRGLLRGEREISGRLVSLTMQKRATCQQQEEEEGWGGEEGRGVFPGAQMCFTGQAALPREQGGVEESERSRDGEASGRRPALT